jgi:hypothetical protein
MASTPNRIRIQSLNVLLWLFTINWRIDTLSQRHFYPHTQFFIFYLPSSFYWVNRRVGLAPSIFIAIFIYLKGPLHPMVSFHLFIPSSSVGTTAFSRCPRHPHLGLCGSGSFTSSSFHSLKCQPSTLWPSPIYIQ